MRRHKARKYLPVLAAVLSLVLLLAGCGQRAERMDRRETNRPTRKTEARSSRSSAARTRDTAPTSEARPTGETTEAASPTEAPPPTEQMRIYGESGTREFQSKDPQWETMGFTWECQYGRDMIEVELTVDAKMYDHYRKLPRHYNVEDFSVYVNDENNRAVIREIVDAIEAFAEDCGYSDDDVAREVAKFVQDTIEYQYDIDSTGKEEYPRYPIETLYERRGDCEDTSILMAVLLKELGYEVGLIHVPGHMAVALRTFDTYDDGAYYEMDGHRYLFIESTASGWKIGDLPDKYRETGAKIYIVP